MITRFLDRGARRRARQFRSSSNERSPLRRDVIVGNVRANIIKATSSIRSVAKALLILVSAEILFVLMILILGPPEAFGYVEDDPLLRIKGIKSTDEIIVMRIPHTCHEEPFVSLTGLRIVHAHTFDTLLAQPELLRSLQRLGPRSRRTMQRLETCTAARRRSRGRERFQLYVNGFYFFYFDVYAF